MRSIFVCLLVGGCGFQAGAAGDAAGTPIDGTIASTGDARDDAMIDGPPPTCWQRWYDHSVALGNPARIDGLSTTAGSERDPWISADGKRIYFNRNPGEQGLTDIYLATRDTASGPWRDAQLQANLSTNLEESRASFTEDELVVVLSSNRANNQYRVLSNTRNAVTDPFGTPVDNGFDMVNAMGGAGADHYDPFFANDGKTLYFAPDPMGPDRQHIWIATRPALNAAFGAPARVPVINGDNNTVGDSDPALSPDERVIVFASTRPGGKGQGDLYYATRASRDVNFGPPDPIPMVNHSADDGDPMLSRDGCDLYFSSARIGTFDLFLSHVSN